VCDLQTEVCEYPGLFGSNMKPDGTMCDMHAIHVRTIYYIVSCLYVDILKCV